MKGELNFNETTRAFISDELALAAGAGGDGVDHYDARCVKKGRSAVPKMGSGALIHCYRCGNCDIVRCCHGTFNSRSCVQRLQNLPGPSDTN